MAVASETKINLTALQRIDPLIVQIIDCASQVALYQYNISKDEWEEPDIKGSLFLCKRSQVPYHGVVIMNMVSTTNHVEQFKNGLDFVVKEPYLLYKNLSGNIFGIWFYNAKDCSQLTGHIQRIVKAMKGKGRQRFVSESDVLKSCESSSPSIIDILARAQQEYEDSGNKPALNSPVRDLEYSDHNGHDAMSSFTGSPFSREKSTNRTVLRSVSLQDSNLTESLNLLSIPWTEDSKELNFTSHLPNDRDVKSSHTRSNADSHPQIQSDEKHLSNALLHLLRNDGDLLTKIHEAYISSLRSHMETFRLS